MIACGGGGGSKPAGSEGGPCSSNQTCNQGLTCLSSTCVRPLDGSATGSAGTGGMGGGTAGSSVAGVTGAAGAGGITDAGAAGSSLGGADAGPGADASGGADGGGAGAGGSTGIACTPACTGGETCADGTCACGVGLVKCASSGCQDLATSKTDCGMCGSNCSNGTCTSGVCTCGVGLEGVQKVPLAKRRSMRPIMAT
jgi:hypothetical protein